MKTAASGLFSYQRSEGSPTPGCSLEPSASPPTGISRPPDNHPHHAVTIVTIPRFQLIGAKSRVTAPVEPCGSGTSPPRHPRLPAGRKHDPAGARRGRSPLLQPAASPRRSLVTLSTQGPRATGGHGDGWPSVTIGRSDGIFQNRIDTGEGSPRRAAGPEPARLCRAADAENRGSAMLHPADPRRTALTGL